jgi:hypothetical protein
MADLDADIRAKIGDDHKDDESFAEFPDITQIPTDIFMEDKPFKLLDHKKTIKEADNWTPESYVVYLTAEVLLG